MLVQLQRVHQVERVEHVVLAELVEVADVDDVGEALGQQVAGEPRADPVAADAGLDRPGLVQRMRPLGEHARINQPGVRLVGLEGVAGRREGEAGFEALTVKFSTMFCCK